MIKFFRKIRQELLNQNRFRKYLLYAIGEIFLVVVGILIALQINNWNQIKNEQNKIKEYAISLIQDLEADIRMTNQIRKQNLEIIARIDSLNGYTRNRKIEDYSNLALLFFTLNMPHRPYVWNRTTITELKNSGALGLIKNDSLSKMISEYDAFTYHLDQDFINDRTQFEKATELSASVVNQNYPNIYQLSEKFRSIRDGLDQNIFESEDYIKAKNSDIGIITKEISEIYKMTNSYIVLSRYLRVRTDLELPKLNNDAKDIIALLKETYIN